MVRPGVTQGGGGTDDNTTAEGEEQTEPPALPQPIRSFNIYLRKGRRWVSLWPAAAAGYVLVGNGSQSDATATSD